MGSSASGTRATVTPMANTKACWVGLSTSTETSRKIAPTLTAIAAVRRTTPRRPRVSGVSGLVVEVVSRAIPARRVCWPIAVTRAHVSPSTTNVPANSGSPLATPPASLSPVSIEESTSNRFSVSTTASAGTRSPLSSSAMSSTTTSSASITCRRPSRQTVIRVGSIC